MIEPLKTTRKPNPYIPFEEYDPNKPTPMYDYPPSNFEIMEKINEIIIKLNSIS